MDNVINMKNITKTYKLGQIKVEALKEINLQVEKGEFISIMGPSGSGKSTLLNLIGCLDKPNDGLYELDGNRVEKLNDYQLSEIRNNFLGFVFQSFNLLSSLNAIKNVEIPLIYRGIKKKHRKILSEEALKVVGLGDRMHHLPNQLSGGQQQRVSIGRALINSPAIVLADEPTGNLDSENSAEIINLLKLSNKKYNQTIIVITHDERIALEADRIISLEDGQIVKDEVIRR